MSTLIPAFFDAPVTLDTSDLTIQTEGLGDDIDVDSLNLVMKGRPAMQFRSAVTAATLTRTIQGASTLEVTLEDPDLTLLNSGFLGGNGGLTIVANQGALLKSGVELNQPVDVELDGLWFRLDSLEKEPTSRSITATFQDREVMLLRSYPKAGDPLEYRVFRPDMTRIQVMRWLVKEVKEIPGDGIRFVSPMLGASLPNGSVDQTRRAVLNLPGFSPSATVTVRGETATKEQLTNIQEVLDAGEQVSGITRKILVVGVMVITQESTAKNLLPSIKGVGLFQQNPLYWPATGDPTTDATAFFERAVVENAKNPSLSYNDLAQAVQHSGLPNAYGQWQTEAEATVTAYTGDVQGVGLSPSTVAGQVAGSPFTPVGPAIQGAAVFARGSQSNEGGSTVVVRETNWACLQRLASEVGWLCYCVSGTIYVETYQHLFKSQVRLEVSEDTIGVDGIGFDVNIGKSTAVCTVQARASRWAAPPGSVAAIKDLGPVDGRWLVQTIERSLFNPSATITLMKPQPTLADAESANPVQGIQLLDPSGTTTSGSGSPLATNPETGFVTYDQGDPRWASHAIYTNNGADTIGADGCGPTSAAMVIATLTGQQITPIDTGDYMTLTGGYVSGGATVAGLSAVVQHYGLKTRPITSFDEAAALITAGGLVIAGGQGAPPYTTHGHVVVLRNILPDGSILIGNPAGSIPNPPTGFKPPIAGTLYMIGVTR